MALKEAAIDEPVLHSDETGTRVDAHTACTDRLTYIAVHENRGKKGMDAIGVHLAGAAPVRITFSKKPLRHLKSCHFPH